MCTLPVIGFLASGRATNQVVISFFSCRCLRIRGITGCLSANFSRIASEVENCPLFVRFALGSSFRFSNRSSPTSLGEEMLK